MCVFLFVFSRYLKIKSVNMSWFGLPQSSFIADLKIKNKSFACEYCVLLTLML